MISRYIKFKDYLRKIKDNFEIEISDLKETITIYNITLKYASEHGVLAAIRYYKESVEECNYHEDGIIKDFSSLEELKNAIFLSEKKIAILEENITVAIELIRSFNNDQPFKYIKDLMYLLNYLANAFYDQVLDLEDCTHIWGSVMYYNGHNEIKNNSNMTIEELIMYIAVSTLSKFQTKFYNQDGDFVKSAGYIAFIHSFQPVKNLRQIDSSVTTNNKDSKALLNDLIFQISESYYDFFIDCKEDAVGFDKLYKETLYDRLLKEYYRNGILVKIPEDLDEFYRILRNSTLGENEKNYVTELVSNNLKKRSLAFLNDYELEILSNIQAYFNTLKEDERDYYLLKQIFEELFTLRFLYQNTMDEEERKYLDSFKNELINLMKLKLDKLNIQEKLSNNFSSYQNRRKKI